MASKSGAAEELEDDRCKESRRLPSSGNTLLVTNKFVKDEFLGGDRESCHANTVQMPVREFTGGSQPEEEEGVLSLLKELREEALQQIKKSKMSRSKVILALRPASSDKLFFDSIRYRYDMRVFLSIRYDTIRYSSVV